MTVKCTAFCRRCWNVSQTAHIPDDGYVCPQCQAELNRIARENGRRVYREPGAARQWKEGGYVVCTAG